MTQDENTLTKVTHAWVRRRDCPNGYGYCISCGRVISLIGCHAGHYIPCGESKATRWHPANVNAQCVECNIEKRGNPKGYREGIIRKYGKEMLDELERLAKTAYKPSHAEVKEAIAQRRKLLKELQ